MLPQQFSKPFLGVTFAGMHDLGLVFLLTGNRVYPQIYVDDIGVLVLF